MFTTIRLASATPFIYTYSSTGYIGSGFDNLGLFGESGASLSGLPFELSVRFQADDDVVTNYSNAFYNGLVMYGSPVSTYSVTVGGQTYTETLCTTTRCGQSASKAYMGSFAYGGRDWGADTTGIDTLGRTVHTYQDLQATKGISSFGNGGFTTPVTYSASAAGGGVNISFVMEDIMENGRTVFTQFNAYSPAQIYINTQPPSNNVPEPSSAILLGGGLLGLVFLRKRRRA